MKSLIFAIDFDGTCVTHRYPMIGEDIGAAPVLKRIVDKGHKIILCTMRSGDLLDEAEDWFLDNGIELYALNKNPGQKRWTSSPKIYANIYIDDAALGCPLIFTADGSRPYVDWEKVEYILEEDGII